MKKELKTVFDRTSDTYAAALVQLDALALQIGEDDLEAPGQADRVDQFLALMPSVKLADMSKSLGYVMQNAVTEVLDRVTVVAEDMAEADYANLGSCVVDMLALAHQYRQIPGAQVNRENSGLGDSRMAAEDLEKTAFFALEGQSRGMTPSTFEEISKYIPDLHHENEAYYNRLCDIFYDKLEAFATAEPSREFTAELADRYQALLHQYCAETPKHSDPYVNLTAEIFDRLSPTRQVNVLESAVQGYGIFTKPEFVRDITHPLLSRFAKTNAEFIEKYTQAGGVQGLLDRGTASEQMKLSFK
ncbi:MAG: hypothetical protein PHX61_04060 [Alphaproteobacteria bacterium]|nr:hypothetical protein [Alphaproteobacteria bacterium]